MPQSSETNPQVAHVQHNGTIYDILDTAHETLTVQEITLGQDTESKFITAQVLSSVLGSAGTVTDVQVNGNTVVAGGVGNINTKSAYNASSNKIVTETDIANFITGGSNSSSAVTIVPTTTSVYSITGLGSTPSLTFAKDTTDTKQLNITWSAGSTPSREQVNNLWNGYSSATAGAQSFTGTNNIQSVGGNTF